MTNNVKRAPQRQIKTESEVRNVAVSLEPVLSSGELLTGTPTVTEITTSALTLDNKAVNTGALTINGVSVAVGQAVQFNVAGGSANTDYNVRVICATDASPAQTLYGLMTIGVVADT